MEKKLNAIIVEDEENESQLLVSLLKDYNFVEIVGTADNVDDAVEEIETKKPDIVFLDVKLYNENGFDVLERIKDKKINPKIIFTTAHKDYAIEAIKHAAFDYILKPIEREKLAKTLERIKNFTEETNLNQKHQKLILYNKISIPEANKISLVDLDHIIYIETLKGETFTKFHLINNKELLAIKGIGNFETELLKNNFLKITRSIIINPKHLTSIVKNGNITFTEGSIKLSKSKIKELMRILKNNL